MTEAKDELLQELKYDLSMSRRRLHNLEKDKVYINNEHKRYKRLVEEEQEKILILEGRIRKHKRENTEK